MGHRQILQNQIRRRKALRLIRFSTVCLQTFLLNLNKNEKYHPKTLKLEMGRPFDKDGKFH